MSQVLRKKKNTKMMRQESFLHREEGGASCRGEMGVEGRRRCSGRETSLASDAARCAVASPQSSGERRWEQPVTHPTNKIWGVSSALACPGTQELLLVLPLTGDALSPPKRLRGEERGWGLIQGIG